MLPSFLPVIREVGSSNKKERTMKIDIVSKNMVKENGRRCCQERDEPNS